MFHVGENDSVHNAIRLMTRNGIGLVLVMPDGAHSSPAKDCSSANNCGAGGASSDKAEKGDKGSAKVPTTGEPMDLSYYKGIFTTRDFLHKVVKPGLCYKSTPIKQVMTQVPTVAKAEDPAIDTLHRLLREDKRHAIVAQHNKVLGVVSRNDLVRKMYKDYEATTEYLLDLVMGTYSAGPSKA